MAPAEERWDGFQGAQTGDQGSLRGYLETIRERPWFVFLVLVVCTLGAAFYAFTAQKQYTTSAQVLVTPVPGSQTNVLGLGLLPQGTDPTQDVTTSSRLIDNMDVAILVRRDLGLRESPRSLLQDVSVNPVANTSIVSVTATTPSPQKSQALANAFAAAAVQRRTSELYQALDPAITNLTQRIAALRRSGTPVSALQPLYQQLATYDSLRSGPDPTLRVESTATLPTGPSSPRTKLIVVGGIVAGLLIGIAGAFLLKALDPRRAREGGLGVVGLPILTSVPPLGRHGGARHAFDEAFRSLRTTLRFVSASNELRTIAVTSPSEKEGKTTTSFQLAMAFLEAGQSVLLVEADPFRPELRPLVDVSPDRDKPGLVEYLSGLAGLDDVIGSTNIPGLMFVSAGERQPASIAKLLEGDRADSFFNGVAGLADVAIFDCPPVGLRSDGVLITSRTDGVLLVVDLQRSSERDVSETVRRLRSSRAELLGIVLNRDSAASAAYEYHERPLKPTLLSRTLSRH